MTPFIDTSSLIISRCSVLSAPQKISVMRLLSFRIVKPHLLFCNSLAFVLSKLSSYLRMVYKMRLIFNSK